MYDFIIFLIIMAFWGLIWFIWSMINEALYRRRVRLRGNRPWTREEHMEDLRHH